jgi:hypothetical protein
MRRHLAGLMLLPLLGACPPAAPADEPPSGELVVIDLRPPEEKAGNGLAPLSGKCNKEVFRIADVASDPLKVELLRQDLVERLPPAEDRRTLTVLNWSIYYNKQVQTSGGGLGSIGVQGYSLPGKKKERKAGSICSRKESAGGWYEAGEIHSVYFPLVSEFEGTFGGKPVKARIVHSPRRKLAGEFEGAAEDTEALLEAIHQTADAVATAIVQ